VIWFTGLPGAGKTTISGLLQQELELLGFTTERLDGDAVREHLSAGLGYSKSDRDTNVERIAWVASRVARAGAVVIVAAISPYEDARERARRLIQEHVPFFCVHVATSIEECSRRDPKGLYRRARAGEIQHLTGVDDPYECPLEPELRLETENAAPTDSVNRVLNELKRAGLVDGSPGRDWPEHDRVVSTAPSSLTRGA
jgi:adenylyl-sulfate kinase